jgi:hypothetical protein
MAGVGLLVIVVVGACWLQQRDVAQAATTSRLVSDALAEALRREGEARSRAIDDATGWDAAIAEAHRADDLLKQGRNDVTLRSRVDAVLAALGRQREEAAARAERLQVDRKLLTDLDGARNGSDSTEAFDQNFAAAFAAAGLDVDRSTPEVVGAWIAARPTRDELVPYLDD